MSALAVATLASSVVTLTFLLMVRALRVEVSGIWVLAVLIAPAVFGLSLAITVLA